MRTLLVFFGYLFLCPQFAYSQAALINADGIIMLIPNQNPEDNRKFLKRGSYDETSHLLGDSIRYKLNEFEKTYVYFESGNGAYPVEQRFVIKPELYKKIKSVDKALVKLAREKKLSINEAQTKLSFILSMSLKLVNYDTRQVEKDIKRLTKPEDVINYLLKIRLYEVR